MSEIKILTVKQTPKVYGFGKPSPITYHAVEFPNNKVALLDQNDTITVYLTRDLMVKEMNKAGVTQVEEVQNSPGT